MNIQSDEEKSCFTSKGLLFGKTTKESGTRVCGNSVTDTLLGIQKALDFTTTEKEINDEKINIKCFLCCFGQLLWVSSVQSHSLQAFIITTPLNF